MDSHTLIPQSPVSLSFAANETVKLQPGHSLARLLCAGRHSALVRFLLIFTFLWLFITSPYPCCLSVLPFTTVHGEALSPGSNQSRGDQSFCCHCSVPWCSTRSLGLRSLSPLLPCCRSCIIPLRACLPMLINQGSSKHHFCLRSGEPEPIGNKVLMGT